MKRFLFFSISLLAVALVAGCASGFKNANPSGTLEATEVDLASVMAGRILQVRALLGDDVKAGDTLVTLDTELLGLQRAQSETNRKSIHTQREVALESQKQAQQNSELAATTYQRTKALFDQGSATSQQVDEAQTKRDVTKSQVMAAKHQLEVLEAEESKLNASLSVYDRQLKDGVILSPITGTVILRNSEPGEVASPGAVMLRLADLRSLDLRVYLGEKELSRVKIGQEVPVLIDALKGKTLSGRVEWISSDAEFTPKNVQTRDARTQLVYAIKVNIANPNGDLHIGMPAEIKLPASER